MEKFLLLKNNNEGFTVVEFLVTLTVIALITAAAFVSLRTGGDRLALERSASNVALKVREAENLALSLRSVEGQTPFGYGVSFETGSGLEEFVLYADLDGSRDFWTASGFPEEERVETVKLESGIRMEIESPSPSPDASAISANFTPPDPLVTLREVGGALSNDLQGPVTLRLFIAGDPSQEKRIRIFKTGLVEIIP